MGLDDLKKQEVGTHRSQTTGIGFICKKKNQSKGRNRDYGFGCLSTL